MKRRARLLEVFVWASCSIGSACGDPGYQLDGGAEPFVNEDRATGSKETPNKSGADTAAAGKRAQANGGSGGRTSSEGGSSARAGSDAAKGGQGGSGGKGGTSGALSSAAGSGNRAGSSAAGSSGSSNGTKLGDPATCEPCERTIPADSSCHGARDLCLGATGTAAHGPKAGAPLGQLCSELVSCIFTTGCGSGKESSGDKANWSNCLCGKGNDCVVNNTEPKGPCKDQFIAATETADLGQIANRFYDLSLASGLAVQVVECDNFICPFECGICVPENGPSATGDATCHPASNDADAGI